MGWAMTDATAAMQHDLIRQWAREKGIPVGSRGRLPQTVVAAYQEEMRQPPDDSPALERQKQPEAAAINSFDPLADYLEPRFGDIYEQPGEHWTPELEAAVTEYLLREVTDADYALLAQVFGWPRGNRAMVDDDYAAMVRQVYGWQAGTRDQQTAWIIEHHRPWNLAYFLHRIAIRNAPTLRTVLTNRPDYLDADDLRWDAGVWLGAHATYDKLAALARIKGLTRKIPTPWDFPGDANPAEAARARLLDVLMEALSADEFVDGWSRIADVAPTDLTDEEWNLLEPLLPSDGDNRNPRATRLRVAINGMLYQHAHRGERSPLPPRFGRRKTLRMRKRRYRKDGVLTNMLAFLEGKPEAARIVAWLRSELKEPGPVRQETDHD